MSTAQTLYPWIPRRKNSPGWLVDPETGCHIWQGARDSSGYALARVSGKNRRVYAVRYEREIGPISKGLVLDHYRCDNGPGGCCNPHHCRPVTQRENVLRGRAPTALNASKTHCIHGHLLDGENLIENNGRRQCRECFNASHRRRRARRTDGDRARAAAQQRAYVARKRLASEDR